jgi:hypothetical protein
MRSFIFALVLAITGLRLLCVAAAQSLASLYQLPQAQCSQEHCDVEPCHDGCSFLHFLKTAEDANKVIMPSFQQNPPQSWTRLARFEEKARSGAHLTVVLFGGSFAAGGGANRPPSPPNATYFSVFESALRETYPQSSFSFHNLAQGAASFAFPFLCRAHILANNNIARPDLFVLDFVENFDNIQLFDGFLHSLMHDPELDQPAVIHLSVAFKGCFVQDAAPLPSTVGQWYNGDPAYCASRSKVKPRSTDPFGFLQYCAKTAITSVSCESNDSCCPIRTHVSLACSRAGVLNVDFVSGVDAFCKDHGGCYDSYGNNMFALFNLYDGYGPEGHAWHSGHYMLAQMLLFSVKYARFACLSHGCEAPTHVQSTALSALSFQCRLTLTHGQGSELVVLATKSYKLASDDVNVPVRKDVYDRRDVKDAYVPLENASDAFLDLHLPVSAPYLRVCLLLWGSVGDTVSASCGHTPVTFLAGVFLKRVFSLACKEMRCTQPSLHVQPQNTSSKLGVGIAGLIVAETSSVPPQG